MHASDSRTKESLARVPEVATFLNVSRSKIYQMMDAGELRYVKLGKSRRLRWNDVMELVEGRTVKAHHQEASRQGPASDKRLRIG